MVGIILADIVSAGRRYIPYAMITGAFNIAALLFGWGLESKQPIGRMLRQYKYKLFLSYIMYIYCFCIAFITFFSREPGTGGGFCLRLFHTLSEKLGDNISPVENVILFIPFGILLPLLWKKFRSVFCCLGAAFLFSLTIETSQYLSKRGYFEIDDIITNLLGCMLGYAILQIFLKLFRQNSNNGNDGIS